MEILQKLFGSKKFIVALTGIIVSILGANDIIVPEAAVQDVVTLVAAYLVGQGMADLGKEKK